MAVLQIHYLGDSILRKKARPVSELDGDLRKLAGDMIETMYFKQGVGLAAPQVGVPKQMIVYDNPEAGYGMGPQVLINPRIVSSEGSVKDEEGCLSVPELTDIVERSERVTVTGLDLQGRELELEAEGLAARILEHEIDHLEGILFVDRVGAVKKKLLLSKWRKVRKELEAERSA
ncbi:MAG TPA: peptide deformylase [archaeon]|nr:peptide deformylase [archaeon]